MPSDIKKNKKPFSPIILMILALLTSGFLIYEIYLLDSIENKIRYIVMGVLLLIDLIFLIKSISVRHHNHNKDGSKKHHKGYVVLILLFSIICALGGAAICYLYGTISGINKKYTTYTSDLIVMSSSKIKNISGVKNLKIGILSDKESPTGYIIPQEIINQYKLQDSNDFKKYDDYSSMIADLYSGNIKAMFITDNYATMFSSIEAYAKISSDTRVVTSKSKRMLKTATSKEESASSGKSITEPFTILLMGVDSTDEVLAKDAIANGDTLILITFNPKTLNATMLSIPRDSYVPIACWSDKAENKITHAAGYGTDCMLKTIENYFDIDIDYYAKLNFKGFVKLVDAVGGVDMNVEQELCTDDSSRSSQVCIKPGQQTLDGEHALVYARDRKQLTNGDFGRAYHQQLIVMALIDKIKQIKSVTKFSELLNTISNSMDTNLTTKQILSFYNIAKDIMSSSSSSEADIVNIQRLYLQGDGQMIYDERMRMVLWDYIVNTDSRDDDIAAMKVNLGKTKYTAIKEFSFSINDPYEKTVIGYGPYNTNSNYTLLPNFIGYSESAARSLASKVGVSVSFKGSGGTVTAQSYSAKTRVDKIGTLVLTLSGSSTNTSSTAKTTTISNTQEKESTSNESNNTGNTSINNSTGNNQ